MWPLESTSPWRFVPEPTMTWSQHNYDVLSLADAIYIPFVVSPVPLVKEVEPASAMNYSLSTAFIWSGVKPVWPIACSMVPIVLPFALILIPFEPVFASSCVFPSVESIWLSWLVSSLYGTRAVEIAEFICVVVEYGTNAVLIWLSTWDSVWYVAAASFLVK